MNSNREDNSFVSGAGCSYSTLSTYNNGSAGGMGSPPAPMGSVSGVYVVPAWGAPGYNTLTMSGQSCSGYGNINSAYGGGGGDCNQQYVKKLCQ